VRALLWLVIGGPIWLVVWLPLYALPLLALRRVRGRLRAHVAR